jgi:hypothetical protein
MSEYGTSVFATMKLAKWVTVTSAATVAGDMPLTYMTASEQPTDRTRFTNVTVPIVFDVDLNAAMMAQGLSGWRLLVLAFNNSSSTGTWSIIGAADAAGIGSPTLSTGTMSLWPSTDCSSFARIHSRYWASPARTERYLRITINDTTPRQPDVTASGFSTATFFDIGCLLISRAYLVGEDGAGGVEYGSLVRGTDQQSRLIEAEGGPDFPRERPQKFRRSFNLIFAGENAEAEYYNRLAELELFAGNSRLVFLAHDITGTTFQMHRMVCGFMTLMDVSVPLNDYYHLVVTIRGIL